MCNINGIVIKAIDGFYYVEDLDKNIYTCKSRKKFRYKDIKPVVGDRVKIKLIDSSLNEASIEDIEDRKNYLVRPNISNIDKIFIVSSYIEPKMNFELINKLTINFEFLDIEPIVVINKIDLLNSEDMEFIRKIFYKFPYKVIEISVNSGLNINLLKNEMLNSSCCMCGPSGVGKSSLFNKLVDKNLMETSTLSEKISRGKHTTRHIELTIIEDLNCNIIDTPGFTSINILDKINAKNIKDYFIEFEPHKNCKFSGCLHINELECGVKNAVNHGEINENRYNYYVKLYNELLNNKIKN